MPTLVFTLPDDLRAIYLKFCIDLAKAIPVPPGAGARAGVRESTERAPGQVAHLDRHDLTGSDQVPDHLEVPVGLPRPEVGTLVVKPCGEVARVDFTSPFETGLVNEVVRRWRCDACSPWLR